MKRKVLLVSMNVGGGHTALRDSFQTALRKADPAERRFEVELHECRDQAILEFYTLCVRYLRPLQGVLHKLSELDLAMRVLMYKERRVVDEARALLLEKRPDVVVSTHFLMSCACVVARNELRLPTRVVTAIPDYGRPTAGFFPRLRSLQADHVIVMEERAHDHLRSTRRLPPAVLHLSGFLPREPFRQLSGRLGASRRFEPAQRQALVAGLLPDYPQLGGYDPSRPTFLFLGGSAWTEKTLPVLERLLADDAFLARSNLIIVAGGNPAFHAKMAPKVEGRPSVALFGFVTPGVMAQLLSLGDFPVLGSLAPATLHELLELKCGPLLLHHYIPGTEKPHVPYIRHQRLGLYEPDPERMVELLRQAVGLAPLSPELEALIAAFPAQAEQIRAANRERALHLADFLEQACQQAPVVHVGEPYAAERISGGQRAFTP